MVGLLLISASAAGATNFCVNDPGCPASGTAEPTISAALDAADIAPGRDRIQIGPGTYSEPGLVDPADSPVDIVGAGIDVTRIGAPRGAPGAGYVSTLDVQDTDSTVSDMTVLLPDGTGSDTGLVLAGTARLVAVSALPGSTGTGVGLRPGGTFAQGSVVLPLTGSTGVAGYNDANAGTVEDSTITAQSGAKNVVALQRVRIVGTYGVHDSDTSPISTTVDDVLIQIVPDAIGGGGIQAWASDATGLGSTTLTARHVTILGNGAADAIGIDAYASGWWTSLPATVNVVLSSVILRGFRTDLARYAIGGVQPQTSHAPGSGTANLSIDYSDYDPAKRSDTNGTGGTGSITDGPRSLNLDPLFTDPSVGDFSLQVGSPLIGRGAPPPLAPDESTTDLAGNPRVVDGSSDMGAFEYQPPPPPHPAAPPTVTGLILSPDRFAVAPRTTAHASATRRRTGRIPHGTTIHFKLSRTALVTLTVVHPGAGRRSGTRCIAPSRRLRHAKRCDLKLYAFTRHSGAGANAIPFSGRIGHGGRTAMAPGHYLLFATPATNTSRHAGFSVLKG